MPHNVPIICHRSGALCPFCKGLCPLSKRVEWKCRYLPSSFIANFSKIFATDNEVMQGHTHHTYRDYPTSKILDFFVRFGNFNAYDRPNDHAEMPILIKIIAAFSLNLGGIALLVYWLFGIAEFATNVKLFLISMGVLFYSGMKFYELYLDIQEKKKRATKN